jgi:hypothetical protein
VKHDFLIGSVQLNQAFESQGSSGSGGDGITRRSFIKRTGAATVATVVAFNFAESAYASAQDGKTEVSYRFRLFVSEAPERDDLVVSWIDSQGQTTPTEWKLTGSGPASRETAFDKLTPIAGIITSEFANGQEKSTPTLKLDGTDIYDGHWLSENDSTPELHFDVDTDDALDPTQDHSSTLKVDGTTINASLARATAVWTGASITTGNTTVDKVVYITDDGTAFSTKAAAEAYAKTHGGANVDLAKLKAKIDGSVDMGITGKIEGGAEKTHNYQKTVDQTGTATWQEQSATDCKVSGTINVRWHIQVQRQTLTQNYKKRLDSDGYEADGPPTMSNWEAVDHFPSN